jgi:hypothetical protein
MVEARYLFLPFTEKASLVMVGEKSDRVNVLNCSSVAKCRWGRSTTRKVQGCIDTAGRRYVSPGDSQRFRHKTGTSIVLHGPPTHYHHHHLLLLHISR